MRPIVGMAKAPADQHLSHRPRWLMVADQPLDHRSRCSATASPSLRHRPRFSAPGRALFGHHLRSASTFEAPFGHRGRWPKTGRHPIAHRRRSNVGVARRLDHCRRFLRCAMGDLRTAVVFAPGRNNIPENGRDSPFISSACVALDDRPTWHVMPQIIDVTNPPEDLDKLLEDSMPEIKALDQSRMVRRLVSRQRVLELTDVLLVSWASLGPWIEEELSPARAEQRNAELKRLDARAWIYYAADLAATEVHSNVNRKQRDLLAKTVKGHDKFLFKWAVPFFSDDPGHAETLRDIARGTGRRDDAEDVLRLVSLFRSNPSGWSEVKDGDKKLDKAYLDQAHADATKQLDYLRNGVANPARIVADAAYSLWFFDYDELMQLGRYLTRRQVDSLDRFPGVRELPTFDGAAPDDEEAIEEEEADDGELDEVNENEEPVPTL
jgi:hypothetical protein